MKKKSVIILLIAMLFLLTACEEITGIQKGLSLPEFSQSVFDNPQKEEGEVITISKKEYENLVEVYQKYAEIERMEKIVEETFYKEVDEETMLYGAKKGFLASLGDPYTFYYTPEEYAKMWEEDEGEYVGVGMQITTSFEEYTCVISRVFRNTPAEKGGILKKDQLIRVEDLEVTPHTINEAVDIMRGEVGGTVEIEVKRGEENIVFNLTREDVKTNSEEYMMLDEQVGYIALYNFSQNSYAAFKKALDELLKQEAKGLIIDLRDNPGGWLTDALSIADEFIDGKQVITYTEDREGKKDYSYSTKGAIDIPLVVLINEHSASASELLSGALKDYEIATIMGVNSFGKGVVQSVRPVGFNGSGMQLTTAQYFTPLEKEVHEKGIAPNIEVNLPEGDIGMYAFGDLADIQLKAALDEVIKQIENGK